jgi:hypothetical protein
MRTRARAAVAATKAATKQSLPAANSAPQPVPIIVEEVPDNPATAPRRRMRRQELEDAIVTTIPIIRRQRLHPTQGSIARALDQDVFQVRQALRRLRRRQRICFTLKEIVPNRQTRVYFLPSKKKTPTNE